MNNDLYQAPPFIAANYFDEPYRFVLQRPNVEQVMQKLRSQHNNLYAQLEQAGMNRRITEYVFYLIVSFALNQASVDQSANQIYRRFKNQIPWFGLLLRQFNISQNLIDRILLSVIQIVLDEFRDGVGQPSDGWVGWEDLGGILTSAPAVASWQPNRLDVFVRGTDQSLYHKWWDGSRWSDWESLGGTLTSAPAVSSWQPNRLDVFSRGSGQTLYHKWWDGRGWNGWESLGGTLTSSPAAVSWGPNRIDVFARGQNQNLIHKWWDGFNWSNWESLGGTLTSGPAVSSTRPNQLQVFARGTNNDLFQITWNGSRWSSWQNLGGNLDYEPAAVSWRPNRIDVFARGRNQSLIHLYRQR